MAARTGPAPAATRGFSIRLLWIGGQQQALVGSTTLSLVRWASGELSIGVG